MFGSWHLPQTESARMTCCTFLSKSYCVNQVRDKDKTKKYLLYNCVIRYCSQTRSACPCWTATGSQQRRFSLGSVMMEWFAANRLQVRKIELLTETSKSKSSTTAMSTTSSTTTTSTTSSTTTSTTTTTLKSQSKKERYNQSRF